MINITKWMGVDIGDIRKIYGVDKATILKFMAWEVPPDTIDGELALFAGGKTNRDDIEYVIINTLSNATYFSDLTVIRLAVAGCSNAGSNRGLVANSAGAGTIDYVTINTPANAQLFGTMEVDSARRAGLSNGTNNRGVFGGGYVGTYLNAIDYVNISTLSDGTDFGNLVQPRQNLGACSNGESERGLFGGGQGTSASIRDEIEYITINSAGNATDLCNLSLARQQLAGLSNGTNDRGVFGGGHSGGTNQRQDYKTISTGADAVSFGNLIAGKEMPGAASSGVNERGIFAGGGSSTGTMDYITITTPAAAGDFGDLVIGRYELCGVSNAATT